MGDQGAGREQRGCPTRDKAGWESVPWEGWAVTAFPRSRGEIENEKRQKARRTVFEILLVRIK